jgi:hypothetical protein
MPPIGTTATTSGTARPLRSRFPPVLQSIVRVSLCKTPYSARTRRSTVRRLPVATGSNAIEGQTHNCDSARAYLDQRLGRGALMRSIIQAPFASFRSQKASLI